VAAPHRRPRGLGEQRRDALLKRDLAGDWQPDGGRIVRDAQGRATGVFVDNAQDLVEAVMPPLDEATATRALELGMQEAVSHGLTGVHDAGIPLAELQRYARLADAGDCRFASPRWPMPTARHWPGSAAMACTHTRRGD
jgi:predicted amidohydrolase YtcJ